MTKSSSIKSNDQRTTILLYQVCFKFIFITHVPIFQVIVPIIKWQEATFSRPVLAMVLFTCIALFPSFLLPSSPCMWTAGMAFGYGYGFLIITGAISIGVSLPYFIGSLFHQRLHVRLLQVNLLFSS